MCVLQTLHDELFNSDALTSGVYFFFFVGVGALLKHPFVQSSATGALLAISARFKMLTLEPANLKSHFVFQPLAWPTSTSMRWTFGSFK